MMPDIKSGVRMFLREPGFTAGAIVVLALGMGATTTVVTLVHSILLRPLAYPSADRLTWIWGVPPHGSTGVSGMLGGDFLEFRERARSFESIAGLYPGSWILTGSGQPA